MEDDMRGVNEGVEAQRVRGGFIYSLCHKCMPMFARREEYRENRGSMVKAFYPGCSWEKKHDVLCPKVAWGLMAVLVVCGEYDDVTDEWMVMWGNSCVDEEELFVWYYDMVFQNLWENGRDLKGRSYRDRHERLQAKHMSEKADNEVNACRKMVETWEMQMMEKTAKEGGGEYNKQMGAILNRYMEYVDGKCSLEYRQARGWGEKKPEFERWAMYVNGNMDVNEVGMEIEKMFAKYKDEKKKPREFLLYLQCLYEEGALIRKMPYDVYKKLGGEGTQPNYSKAMHPYFDKLPQ